PPPPPPTPQVGSAAVECVLSLSPPATLEAFHAAALDKKCAAYLDDAHANYVLQALLAHAPPALAESVCTELLKCGRLADVARRGVLFRALDRCAEVEGGGLQERYFNAAAGIEVGKMLGVALPEKEGGRMTVDVNGARCLNRLLKFDKVWSEKVMKRVQAGLDARTLKCMCMDGFASKVVVEAVLEGGGAEWVGEKLKE
ncbi:hypothetical protein TeGR_g9031, partial [Tetraparma gracilis]